MILFINSSQTDLIQLKLIDKGKVISQMESHKQFKQSELLLGMIDKLLKSEVGTLKSIAVVSGPGAFSALRFGITTANALAWSLGVPVVELSTDEVKSDEDLVGLIKQRTKNKNFIPVVPKYGREPNITSTKGSLN